MIISPGRNFIFVHIPKTGGTSLALALEARAMADDILIGDTPKARRRQKRIKGVSAHGPLWKHSRLSDIEGLVSRDFIAGAFVVTLVRNPWDRLVSLYEWSRHKQFQHPLVTRARQSPFDGFLYAIETQRALRNSLYDAYVKDSDGRAYEAHFIRLERFETEAAPLWAHLGFELELPHVNASDRRRDYRSYYDVGLRDLVAEIHADEIARFGYDFDTGLR